MPFVILGSIMILVSVFVFMMAAHEHSTEMVYGGAAILLAGGALLTLFLVFQR